MAVSIKAHAVSTAGNNYLVIPNTTSVGDLLVFYTSSYNQAATLGTGAANWTNLFNASSTSGGWPNHHNVWWKKAESGDAGLTQYVSWYNSNFSALTVLVLTGYDTVSASPINSHKFGAQWSTTNFNSTQNTPTKKGLSLGLVAHMANANTSTVSFNQSWGTHLVTAPAVQYAALGTFYKQVASGEASTFSGTASLTGGDNVASIIQVAEGNTSNTWVMENGAWKKASHNIMENGAFKQLPATVTF